MVAVAKNSILVFNSNSNSRIFNSNSIFNSTSSIPIPELELDLSCNSNSGIELTPTLPTTTHWHLDGTSQPSLPDTASDWALVHLMTDDRMDVIHFRTSANNQTIYGFWLGAWGGISVRAGLWAFSTGGLGLKRNFSFLSWQMTLMRRLAIYDSGWRPT